MKFADTVLRVTYTRSAFQIPGDDSVRINLDSDIALIREDALDEDRPCRDPTDWHRRDIDDPGEEYPFPHVRKGEISRFPYAVLEIKTSQREHVSSNGNTTTNSSDPQWVSDLMKSHLVKEAPRFSKYAHGVSVLFEAYVNLLPFWLSEMDEDIRRDPQKVYEEQEQKAMSKANHPYKALEQQPIWKVLERAIDALVANGDLKASTAREYVIGFLAKSISEAGFTPVSELRTSGKTIHVIEVQEQTHEVDAA